MSNLFNFLFLGLVLVVFGLVAVSNKPLTPSSFSGSKISSEEKEKAITIPVEKASDPKLYFVK